MNLRSCVIGLDIGTSSVKVAAFDATGHEITRAAETLEQRHAEPGAAEQDPQIVYAAVTEALIRTANQAHQLGFRVDRIGLSAAMHSVIPIGANNRPLAPALLWMDTRAGAAAAALWASPAGPALYQRTGTPIHAMSPLAKLEWLREARPDQFAAAARFVSLKEWVWYQWFGDWQIDTSLASATGLYSLRERTWDAEALRRAGITTTQLSTLVPTTYSRHDSPNAQLAAAGLTPQTQWTIGASDGVLANLGVGAIDTEALVMTIGTSLAVRMGSPTPMTDTTSRLFCYVLDEHRFIVGGPSNSGGVVLDWLYRNLLGGPDGRADTALPHAFAELVAAAGMADSDGLLFLPYVAGERAPLWDAEARGVLSGLRLSHSAAQVMRAAIEGILFNAYWVASPLIEYGHPREVIASGKVLEEHWIRQLTADVFGLPVRALGEVDASVMGAAWLANLASGVWTWEDLARHTQGDRGTVIAPREHARQEAAYQRFRQLYATLAAGGHFS